MPSQDVTAKKLMTSFLGYLQTAVKRAVAKTRQTFTEDIVIVMDGSGSIGSCEFKKGIKALKHMMTAARNPSHDTKYAAVTFATTARVNFKFASYSSAASDIAKISYPVGWTNTQAGLAEAKKLFDDPASGIFLHNVDNVDLGLIDSNGRDKGYLFAQVIGKALGDIQQHKSAPVHTEQTHPVSEKAVNSVFLVRKLVSSL